MEEGKKMSQTLTTIRLAVAHSYSGQDPVESMETACISNPVVVKRDGSVVPMDVGQIHLRYEELLAEHPARLDVDLAWLVKKTVAGVASGMRTEQIDTLAEEVCAKAGGAAVDYHDF